MIYAILLAAGESKRMGTLKQILSFGKSTVIQTVINSLLKSNINKVKIILGHKANEVSKLLEKSRVEILVNEDYQSGMLSSIKCGVSSLPHDAQAFMICLVDQPGIKTSDINKLIDGYKKSGKGIIIPTYKGKRGHPVIFDKKYINDIINLKEKGEGLREIVWKNSDDILEIEVENRNIIEDMNNIDEYKELVRIVKEEKV